MAVHQKSTHIARPGYATRRGSQVCSLTMMRGLRPFVALLMAVAVTVPLAACSQSVGQVITTPADADAVTLEDPSAVPSTEALPVVLTSSGIATSFWWNIQG